LYLLSVVTVVGRRVLDFDDFLVTIFAASIWWGAQITPLLIGFIAFSCTRAMDARDHRRRNCSYPRRLDVQQMSRDDAGPLQPPAVDDRLPSS
jgi:hypothetical protein